MSRRRSGEIRVCGGRLTKEGEEEWEKNCCGERRGELKCLEEGGGGGKVGNKCRADGRSKRREELKRVGIGVRRYRPLVYVCGSIHLLVHTVFFTNKLN